LNLACDWPFVKICQTGLGNKHHWELLNYSYNSYSNSEPNQVCKWDLQPTKGSSFSPLVDIASLKALAKSLWNQGRPTVTSLTKVNLPWANEIAIHSRQGMIELI
jgi:hypothetical protein